MNPVFRKRNLENPATFTSQKVTVCKKPGTFNNLNFTASKKPRTLTIVSFRKEKNRVICNK